MAYLKVQDSEFVKDTNSNALLMTGNTAIRENQARKILSSKMTSKNDEINILKSQMQNLNEDVTEIKTLLKKLLNESKQ